MKKNLIYIAGIIIFGLSYVWMKSIMGEQTFFIFAIAYLIFLRLFAEKFGK